MGGYSNLENKKCFGKGKFVSSEGNSHIWIWVLIHNTPPGAKLGLCRSTIYSKLGLCRSIIFSKLVQISPNGTMSGYKTEIRNWRDRNLKIWPTNYHLEVKPKPSQFFSSPNHSPPDHNLDQIFKFRSRQLLISTRMWFTNIKKKMLAKLSFISCCEKKDK